jgi:hypothetical protein
MRRLQRWPKFMMDGSDAGSMSEIPRPGQGNRPGEPFDLFAGVGADLKRTISCQQMNSNRTWSLRTASNDWIWSKQKDLWNPAKAEWKVCFLPQVQEGVMGLKRDVPQTCAGQVGLPMYRKKSTCRARCEICEGLTELRQTLIVCYDRPCDRGLGAHINSRR